MYVCTTRTVIYVVLCTLNLDPANDLVDLGKKEAAAESPVSFFPDFLWMFYMCLHSMSLCLFIPLYRFFQDVVQNYELWFRF